MSVVLLDGPCEGTYSVRRSPHFLRAVISKTGKRDLLDQLNDEPRADETVHVYEADGHTWSVEQARYQGIFLCGRGMDRTAADGDYTYRADVDGETLRDRDAWREWCFAQPHSMPLYDPFTGKLDKPNHLRAVPE